MGVVLAVSQTSATGSCDTALFIVKGFLSIKVCTTPLSCLGTSVDLLMVWVRQLPSFHHCSLSFYYHIFTDVHRTNDNFTP